MTDERDPRGNHVECARCGWEGFTIVQLLAHRRRWHSGIVVLSGRGDAA